MALQVSLDTRFGINLPEAYVRVEAVQWGKGRNAYAEVYVYANAAAKGSVPVSNEGVSFTIDLASTDNVVAQAYAFLKTLPQYTTAINV